MKTFVLTAESAHVPSVLVLAFASRSLANVKAAKLVNIFIGECLLDELADFSADLVMPPAATPLTWQRVLTKLCAIERKIWDDVPSIEILELEVIAK